MWYLYYNVFKISFWYFSFIYIYILPSIFNPLTFFQSMWKEFSFWTDSNVYLKGPIEIVYVYRCKVVFILHFFKIYCVEKYLTFSNLLCKNYITFSYLLLTKHYIYFFAIGPWFKILFPFNALFIGHVLDLSWSNMIQSDRNSFAVMSSW